MCVLALAAVAAQGEPPRSAEMFIQVGRIRFGGDEGSGGSAASYGGSFLLPVSTGWAIDVSVATAHPQPYSEPPSYYSLRSLVVSPAIVRRGGSDRLYGFGGFGVGIQSDRTYTESPYFTGDTPTISGIAKGAHRTTGMTLLGRTGLVWNPLSHLLVRSDVEFAFRYVIPSLTARAGIGWRF